MTDEEFQAESSRLGHALQSGIRMALDLDEPDGDPRELRFRKHLRVGVDTLFAEAGALARLLISKGIITDAEYKAAMIDGLSREVDMHAEDLSRRMGTNIILA